MKEQWFPIYYSLLYSPVFDNPDMLKTWLMILQKKCFKNETKFIRGVKIDLKPGDFLIESRAKAMEFLKMTESRYRTSIRNLEKLGYIKVKTTNKITVISVIKEGYSQVYENENIQADTNKTPGNNQQPSNLNNKYINKYNNKYIYNKSNQENNIPTPKATKFSNFDSKHKIDYDALEKQRLWERVNRYKNSGDENMQSETAQ